MRAVAIRALKPALAALVLAAGFSAAPATAVLITTWEYEVGSGFFDYNPEQSAANPFGVVGSDIGTLGLPTVLSWGNPANPENEQSQLIVTDPVTGPPPALVTDGALVNGATLIHSNSTITGQEDSLTDTGLATRLLLTPLTPPGTQLPPLAAEFDILFEETPNAGPCPDGDVPCPDVFVLLNPQDLVTSFTLDGYKYTVTLLLAGLADLTASACEAAGAEAGCVGLLTNEGVDNSFQAQFGITAVPLQVPEPGVLALLGALFLGLGTIRHRARS